MAGVSEKKCGYPRGDKMINAVRSALKGFVDGLRVWTVSVHSAHGTDVAIIKIGRKPQKKTQEKRHIESVNI